MFRAFQSKKLFEKYCIEPINPKNLTPLPPFPTREWGFQSLSPRRREVWREVFISLQTASNEHSYFLIAAISFLPTPAVVCLGHFLLCLVIVAGFADGLDIV